METGNVGEFAPNTALSPFLFTVSSDVHGKRLHTRMWGCPSWHIRASFTSPQKLLLSHLSTMWCAPALRWLYLGRRTSKTLWINLRSLGQGSLALRCPEPALEWNWGAASRGVRAVDLVDHPFPGSVARGGPDGGLETRFQAGSLLTHT